MDHCFHLKEVDLSTQDQQENWASYSLSRVEAMYVSAA
jgi:hypothetical protein